MTVLHKYLTCCLLFIAMLMPAGLESAHAKATGTPTPASTSTTTKSTTPSAADIASAKSKGLVWCNKNTKVYHKDGKYYGTTKNGVFMTEADAQKAGYKAAKEPGTAKPAATKSPAAAKSPAGK